MEGQSFQIRLEKSIKMLKTILCEKVFDMYRYIFFKWATLILWSWTQLIYNPIKLSLLINIIKCQPFRKIVTSLNILYHKNTKFQYWISKFTKKYINFQIVRHAIDIQYYISCLYLYSIRYYKLFVTWLILSLTCLVFAMITHHYHQGSVFLCNTILHQNSESVIYFLPHHNVFP